MIIKPSPFYYTKMGKAYLGDASDILPQIDSQSIDLICTSPPFALLRKKAYGNTDSEEYVEWFMPFAREFARILKPKGSLVIDIGGSWVKGYPIRSLYHYELLIKLCKPKDEGGYGFLLAQELYWYNPAKLPTPAEWVTVRRERVKDAVNTVWWLCLDPHPKSDNRKVLKPYSEDQKRLMKVGYKPNKRPSEHVISNKFGKDNNGAIPPNIINDIEYKVDKIGDPVVVPVNVISASNTSSNDKYLRLCRKYDMKPHPARFPKILPEFILNLCTEEYDTVLDPFAGSNMTGHMAEIMNRHWIAIEKEEDYLKASKFRFIDDESHEVNKSVNEQIQEKQILLEI